MNDEFWAKFDEHLHALADIVEAHPAELSYPISTRGGSDFHGTWQMGSGSRAPEVKITVEGLHYHGQPYFHALLSVNFKEMKLAKMVEFHAFLADKIALVQKLEAYLTSVNFSEQCAINAHNAKEGK